ncbi:MAG: porin [Cellvibrionales bacterium]|jgi:phosphate-selective porin OprO/OprP|nr:porin [Cellvibrionales bacterium]MBK8676087.1 porin [Cellvibrionales bacterium]
MKPFTRHRAALTVSTLGLIFATLSGNGYAANGEIPPEVLKQLQDLAKQVEQLQKQVINQRNHAVSNDGNGELDALRQKVLVLERKQELAAADAAELKKKTPVVVAGDKGFGLKSPDGAYEIKLRGLLQADARIFNSGIKGLHAYTGDTATQVRDADNATRTATDNFLVRRARISLEGTLGDTYGFRITPDFGSNGSTLVDGYIDANYSPYAKVRVGKFTPSLSLERLQSSSDTKFNELGLSSNFLPSRDIGVQLSGDVFNKTLNYAVGYFNGANDGANGDIDPNTDKELVARVFAQPFANTPGFLQGLSFGVGVSSGDAVGANGNPLLSSYRSSGQENIFSYRTDTSVSNTVLANGTRDRLVPQFSYYNGGFGITGEYVDEKQDTKRVYGTALNQTREEQINHQGWSLTTSYLLTGEEASFKGVKPAKNFDPAKGGWGAWEVKARASSLDIDKRAFYDSRGVLGGTDSFAQATRSVQGADNWAVGVNWYPNSNLRISLDYENTAFDWGGGGTSLDPQDRDDERLLLGRVQVSF